ncbi:MULTISPECIES: hypothetical protein [Cupriavidus]|uniref:hypothetical protein n=1 Tax=Cupriavidus TaxID=106589 RepID=UPI000A5C635A|nr:MULTISPECIES: hypothetical protein [Cupriavidus]
MRILYLVYGLIVLFGATFYNLGSSTTGGSGGASSARSWGGGGGGGGWGAGAGHK